MKTAVIYARYSSDSQNAQSIDSQIRICEEYAKRNDIIILNNYIDKAMTGTNDNRPDFQKMIKDSFKKEWNFVLVYKLDRFSRNQYETVKNKKILKDNSVKILSAMENIPDTPEGIILESLLVGMAEYYSAELAQKINRGIKENWLKGYATGGKHIYGYDIIDKKYVINEKEANIVKDIFIMYSQGYNMKVIAKILNSENKLRIKGEQFTERYICFILHKKRYSGFIEHKGEIYTNIFPAIISQSLWNKVESIIDENKHAPSRKKEIYDFILSGKLICGDCKQKMTGESGTSKTKAIYYYYVCKSKRKKISCSTKAISKEKLEDLVINSTTQMLKQNGNIQKISQILFKLYEETKNENLELKSLLALKDEKTKASDNIIKAIEQGIITDKTKSRLTQLEDELNELEVKISKEKQKVYYDLTQTQIENYLKSKVFENIDDIAIRKLIVNTFIREIFLYEDKIVITYNFIEPLDKNTITRENILKEEEQITSALSSGESLSIKLKSPPKNFYDIKIILKAYKRVINLKLQTPHGIL